MSQWDKHTRFFSRVDALKELNDLKFAIEALAKLVGTPGSFENENAKNIVTGLRARIEYLHRSFELCLAAPNPSWQIPKGPFEAQGVPQKGESIMEVARRQIEASKRDADRHPYIPPEQKFTDGRGDPCDAHGNPLPFGS